MVTGTVLSLLALPQRDLKSHSVIPGQVVHFFLGNCLEKGGCQPCHPKTRPNCMAASLRAPLGPWQRVTLLLAPRRACLSDFHPDHCSGLDQSSKAQLTLWGVGWGGGWSGLHTHGGSLAGGRGPQPFPSQLPSPPDTYHVSVFFPPFFFFLIMP